MTTHVCPICGGKLLDITDGVNRGVRCLNPLCAFNYQDLACPDCQEVPVEVQQPHLGTYELKCDKGHRWNMTT